MGRAIVPLQLDDLGAGEVALEAQDVVHLGPAPAIDRLIVVAHAADIARRGRQQPQPQILGDIGVLIFVDQDVAEATTVFLGQVRVLRQDGDVVQQQIAEIAGVQAAKARLIGGVQPLALAVGEVFAGRQFLGRPAAVLPVVDQARQRLGRPAFGVDIGRFQQLFQHPLLIVGVQDGEGGLQPDQFGVAAQNLRGDGVEGAQPAQPFGRVADQMGDPLTHLAGRLVGEGDGQQFPRLGPARRQDVRQPRGQNPRLARARARQHQHRPLGRLHRLALFRVQTGQIVVRMLLLGRASAGEVGNAGGGEIGHGRRIIRHSEGIWQNRERNIRGPRGNVRAAAPMKTRNLPVRRPVPLLRCKPRPTSTGRPRTVSERRAAEAGSPS